MINLFQFCFSSFWVYAGVTIWLLILTGYFQRKILPAIKGGLQKFTTLFKKEFDKNIKGGK